MRHPELRSVLRSWITDNIREFLRLGPDTDAPLYPPAVSRLDEINAPTLILVGSLDVPDIHDIATHLKCGVRDAKLVSFNNAGHSLKLEDPERFNREVFTFVNEWSHCVSKS